MDYNSKYKSSEIEEKLDAVGYLKGAVGWSEIAHHRFANGTIMTFSPPIKKGQVIISLQGIGSISIYDEDGATKSISTSILPFVVDKTYTKWAAYASNSPEVVLTVASSVIADLSDVATSGDYNDLANKPDLGVYATKLELSDKVDKVSGKQLTTEDFTTALKNKLEGLSNYDDTEIENALASLQGQLNTLVSGNASDAINSFNEIIAFLNGIEDSESLDSIIASIEQQIAGKMDKVTLAKVATSGSYEDLDNKPTIPTIPTALKNPSSLKFGSKTYDGSAEEEITAADLGALTEHQTIHALTINNSSGTAQVTYAPNSEEASLTLTKAMVGLGSVTNGTYAGGTKVTLNGSSKANSTASFYAPTGAGTSGYWLKSSGSGAPTWTDQSSLTAGKATQLANARTIWGRPFDGTGNVNGAISFTKNNASVWVTMSDGTDGCFLQVNPENHLLVGQHLAKKKGDVFFYGNNIRFCYGTAATSGYTAMLINPSGNVTIGASDLAGTTSKLYVSGNVYTSGTVTQGSDIRFKDIIEDKTLDIKAIADAPLFTFKWNDGREDDSIHLGTSAQYWEDVAPWLVRGESFKTLDYATLGVAGIKSLAMKVAEQENRINQLTKEIEELKELVRNSTK